MIFKVRLCAEPMTQLCRLIVKVTVRGHIGIFSRILCLLHISLSQEGFSLNFATCGTKLAALGDRFFFRAAQCHKKFIICCMCALIILSPIKVSFWYLLVLYVFYQKSQICSKIVSLIFSAYFGCHCCSHSNCKSHITRLLFSNNP